MSNTSHSQAGTQGSVVVGVEGSEQGYAVVRFAAAEARRVEASLDLVHVLPGYVSAPPMTTMTPLMPILPDVSFESYAAEILERARETALDEVSSLQVETHLCAGTRVSQLLTFAEGARTVVLGSRSPDGFDRVWTGGTVTGVASRAACPVIVVPADHEPDEVHGRIVAGVKTPGHTAELFDAAFPLADARGAELVVVHAWRLPGVYDDIIAGRTVADLWQREQTELIEKELTQYRAAFPRVVVRVYVRHEEPAHALVRATRGADRLLVMRPTHIGPVHHLGRIARAVFRDGRCPIEVVPARTSAEPSEPASGARVAELVP
jgi:nucleotide-binding universal stress UspA family protein